MQLLEANGYQPLGEEVPDEPPRHVQYAKGGVEYELHHHFSSFGLDLEPILLDAFDRPVTRGIAGMETAFTAKWGTGKPVIGFLGEYDALSGLSQEAGVTEKKVRPGTGNGHGCGHNLLGSAAAGAALMLRDYLKESGRPGTVMFFGCPGVTVSAADLPTRQPPRISDGALWTQWS